MKTILSSRARQEQPWAGFGLLALLFILDLVDGAPYSLRFLEFRDQDQLDDSEFHLFLLTTYLQVIFSKGQEANMC